MWERKIVCVRERERVCERESEKACVCVWVGVRESAFFLGVCVCVCV